MAPMPCATAILPEEGRAIRIRGLVQGVGFRPTVWRLARDCGLAGDVWNDAEGVMIRAWGRPADLDRFLWRLEEQPPPLARIDTVEWALSGECPIDGGFHIASSRAGEVHTAVGPDAATCPACLTETLDLSDRRYRYPFTNCTHCGPRLSIVRAVPYDRCNTSMAEFPLCPACRAEYEDPEDRRFHAQPTACPSCGPQAWLERFEMVEANRSFSPNVMRPKRRGLCCSAEQSSRSRGWGAFISPATPATRMRLPGFEAANGATQNPSP